MCPLSCGHVFYVGFGKVRATTKCFVDSFHDKDDFTYGVSNSAAVRLHKISVCMLEGRHVRLRRRRICNV